MAASHRAVCPTGAAAAPLRFFTRCCRRAQHDPSAELPAREFEALPARLIRCFTCYTDTHTIGIIGIVGTKKAYIPAPRAIRNQPFATVPLTGWPSLTRTAVLRSG